MRQKTLGYLLTAAGFAFVATMTLGSHPELVGRYGDISHTCLICGELGLEDFIVNILLFLPLGTGLRLSGLARWKAFAIAVLTTATVESLQYAVIVGRYASVSDVLSNSIGGGLGILLADHWRALLFPPPRIAHSLARAGTAAWLGIQILSAALLSIALPRTTYYVMWSPELPQFGRFDGTVLDATLGTDALPNGRLEDGGRVRAHLESGHFALQVSARGHSTGSLLAAILFVVDEDSREILLVGEEGQDLFFRVRMRAWDLTLRGPAIRLAVPPSAPGGLLQIRAGLDSGRLFVELFQGGQQYRRQITLSPSWGWSFLLPNEYGFGSEAHFLTALWIAGLLLPVAYWSARATGSQRRRAGVLLLILVGVGLGAVPPAMRIPAVHWSEWLAAAVGLTSGWLLGLCTLSRER